MPFIPGAEEIAKEVMAQINPELSQKFSTVIQFLALNPDRAPDFSRRKVPPEFGGREYIQECAKKFADAHPTKRIKISTTIPDQAALIILEALYKHIGKDVGEVADVLDGHGKCMTIENKVGDLLERYIASIIEKDGWVWCPGEIVKHIDY